MYLFLGEGGGRYPDLIPCSLTGPKLPFVPWGVKKGISFWPVLFFFMTSAGPIVSDLVAGVTTRALDVKVTSQGQTHGNQVTRGQLPVTSKVKGVDSLQIRVRSLLFQGFCWFLCWFQLSWWLKKILGIDSNRLTAADQIMGWMDEFNVTFAQASAC